MGANLEFDLEIGEARRDGGIRRVSVGSVEFLHRMRVAARGICEQRGSVTTDDLRFLAASLNIEPHHPNAWGAIFREPGWVCTGRRKSIKKSNHAREIRVWSWQPRK